MADNAPVPEGAPRPPSLPTAPPLKKDGVGKVVVLLSSVAKAPPVRTHAIGHLAPSAVEPKEAPLRPSLKVVAPPPLPAKQIPSDGKLLRPGGNAAMKLPPKAVTSRWPMFAGSPVNQSLEAKEEPSVVPAAIDATAPASGGDPAPLVPKAPPLEKAEVKKTTARLLIPPIKLNQPPPEPAPDEDAPGESILLGPGETEQEHPTRPRPKIVERPIITPQPTLEVKPPEEAPAPVTPAIQPFVILPAVGPLPEASPGLQPAAVLAEPVPPPAKAPVRPPPLPPPKTLEKPGSPGIHVVPKMVGTEPTLHAEKLRPPPLLPQPASRPEEAKAGGTAAPALPTRGGSPESKVTGPITQKDPKEKTAAVVATPKVAPSSTEPSSKVTGPILSKSEVSKPALRPAVLPSKSLIQAKADEATASAEKAPATLPPEVSTKPAEAAKLQAPVELPPKALGTPPVLPPDKPALPLTRAERAKKRRLVEMIIFYIVLLLVCVGLYYGTLYFTRETRVEGQIIPPSGMPLADEVWIVSDFRDLTAGIAEDLAEERAPLIQEEHEREEHVQRVQADIALREERIQLLQGQIKAAKDEEASVVSKAREDAQQLWDGPGAEMQDQYNARQIELKNAIANRAKSLNLSYAPDPTYDAPEVWANAYRLALYQVPKGVDSAKEYQWLNDQMKQWRDFVKSMDDKNEQLREQAAQIKLAPASKLTDLNAKIDELQHRIDSTESEEDPLKPELQQAQADLADSQTAEAGLDAKYYKQLSALPGASVTKRLQLETNGRFTWSDLENDRPFSEGENEHHFWLFTRATRADGREYWALGRFSIAKDHTVGLLIEPDAFVSTKAMLRPDLSPDEQEQ